MAGSSRAPAMAAARRSKGLDMMRSAMWARIARESESAAQLAVGCETRVAWRNEEHINETRIDDADRQVVGAVRRAPA